MLGNPNLEKWFPKAAENKQFDDSGPKSWNFISWT